MKRQFLEYSNLFLLYLAVILLLSSCITRMPESDAVSGSTIWSDPDLGDNFEEPPLPEIRSENLTPTEVNNMTIYRDNIRSIVNITTVSLYGSRFLGSYSQEGSGSGVIISAEGYILTNRHVVNGADYVVITLYDGTNYQARKIGSDPENDLAVLKFDPAGRNLHVITPGTASDLQVGQTVLALGNPFGLEGTLTIGIVSGLNRPLQTEDGFLLKSMIQTDAAINPGNSGGALLNSRGELIGINTMILSPSGSGNGSGSVGIGFAIPVEVALRIAPELIRDGHITRGWIDIEALSITPSLALQLGIPFIDYGVMVTMVIKGGNAELAGLKGGTERRGVGLGLNSVFIGGDIIISIDGSPIKNVLDYFSVLEGSRPGDVYELEYIRDGEIYKVEVTLSERPRSYRY